MPTDASMLILIKHLTPQSTGCSIADRCIEHCRGVQCGEPHTAAVVAAQVRILSAANIFIFIQTREEDDLMSNDDANDKICTTTKCRVRGCVELYSTIDNNIWRV